MINSKNTACIPKPGSAVPFPFFFTAICMVMVVAYSKVKEPNHTKVFTCLIFLLGSMELLQYIIMAVEAVVLEEYFAASLSFVAFFAMVFCNIVFGCAYRDSVLADQGFKNWIRIYPKTQTLLPILCLVFNFKFIRLVLSGFFGMENTQAVFKNPGFTIHRPLKLATYFQYVFVYAPIFLADIVLFASVASGEEADSHNTRSTSSLRWGHQLAFTAVETFILQFISILITWIEFRNPQALYAEAEVIYSPIKGVMAGVPDDIEEN